MSGPEHPDAPPPPGAVPPPAAPPLFTKKGVPVGTTAAAVAAAGASGVTYIPVLPAPAIIRRPAPRPLMVAAYALALVAALLLPGHPAGIGVALVGASLAAALARSLPTPDRFTIACFVSAGLLALVPAFRASDWVAWLSVLGAVTLASIGAASARTWRETGHAVLVWTAELFPAPFGMIGDGVRRASGRQWDGRVGPIVRGSALGAGLVIVFGTLFASADAAFRQMLSDLVDLHLSIGDMVVRVLVALLVLTVTGALWQVSATRRDRPAVAATSRLGRTEWLIALGAVVFLFAAFVLLQVTTLFGGDGHVLRTAGLTYA